ncbi:adenylyl-sulfate kinase [Streptomyces sp. NPDC048425]|uniref:adenylyl-sulfate kinase n=1 Tax=Streptomyces sp. NPDC048425 TaxID=3365548 RepID=UPI00371823EF
MLPDARPVPRALLITGTVGAGKTSVAEAIGALLTNAEIPSAVMDLDCLRRSWPTPAADRFNVGMLLRNLRCVAGNYLDAGATRLVLAGVAESRADRDHYEEAVGIDLSVCRLRVHLPTVHQRLAHRHGDDHDGLRWHLDRSGELDRILDQAEVEDFTTDANNKSITATATAVLQTANWL